MRHRVAHRKLGRVTEHRLAMLRNQATALLRHEHLTTTVPRAKELRPFVERLITIAKRGVAGGDGNGRALNARRLVLQDLQDREVVSKLFDTLAPRFADRPGGYTRLLRIGYRRGDSAEVAQVELLGSEFNPRAAAEAEAAKAEGEPKKTKGVGGRLRAAAERLRGKKEEEEAAEEGGKTTPKRAAGKGKAAAKPKAKKKSRKTEED
ncbi:MAG: 50S ribosomal protein L17 [Betaproteobacteria bacterium]